MSKIALGFHFAGKEIQEQGNKNNKQGGLKTDQHFAQGYNRVEISVSDRG